MEGRTVMAVSILKSTNINSSLRADVDAIVGSGFPGADPTFLESNAISAGEFVSADVFTIKESATGKDRMIWMDRWGGDSVVGR
jgi:hypothetical protein